jgi:hypothetical protein
MQYDVVAGKITIGSVEAFLRELDAIAQPSNTTIQAVDATKVAGRRHVDCAIRNAMRSFRDHRNIATDLGVEILLHLGRRDGRVVDCRWCEAINSKSCDAAHCLDMLRSTGYGVRRDKKRAVNARV